MDIAVTELVSELLSGSRHSETGVHGKKGKRDDNV